MSLMPVTKSSADNTVVVFHWTAQEGVDIIYTDRDDKYVLSPNAYDSFLKIGLELKYKENLCNAEIEKITKEKDEQINFERQEYNLALVTKQGEINACEKRTLDTREVYGESIKEKDQKIFKLQNPPFYKRNSTWYLGGIITALLLFVAI